MNLIKQYGGFFLLAIAIILLIITNLPKMNQSTTQVVMTSLPLPTSFSSSNPPQITRVIFVEIKGAVRFPGVYRMEEGSRLFELIAKAGGLLSSADVHQINQTVLLSDSSVIVIPLVQTTSIITTKTQTTGMITIQLQGAIQQPGTYVVPSGTPLGDVIELALGFLAEADTALVDTHFILLQNQTITIPYRVAVGTLININTALLDELASLPGIGFILGQRIIDYRAEYGPFEQIEDIMKVSGIKQSIYEKIRDRIKT